MGKHKKSMLEAFNSAGGLTPLKPKESPKPKPEPRQPEPVQPEDRVGAPGTVPVDQDGVITPAPRQPTGEPISVVPSAGGPFAGSPAGDEQAQEEQAAAQASSSPSQAPAAVEAPTASLPTPLPEQAGGPIVESDAAFAQSLQAPSSGLVWLLLALIVISFSAAAWIGKQDSEAAQLLAEQEAAAAEGGDPSAANLGGFAPTRGSSLDAGGEGYPASGSDQQPSYSSATDPLLDPANKFTVVVITFGKSQVDLAEASRAFISDAGLPVNRLLRVGSKLLVCVGASPTKDGLVGLEDRIQQLSLNGEKRVYSDAFIDTIDKYIDR